MNDDIFIQQRNGASIYIVVVSEREESLQGNINKYAALFCLLRIRGEKRERREIL
jgi:hypothetical protein